MESASAPAASRAPSLRAQIVSALVVAGFVLALGGVIAWRSAPPAPPPLPAHLR